MRIVYCISDYSPAGGTERTLSIQANYFAQCGHEVHIIITEVPQQKEPAYKFSDKIKIHELNICYREVDNSTSPFKISDRIMKGRRHKQMLEHLLCQLHPDFTVSLFGHEIAFLYRLKDGSRKVLQYHFSRYSRSIECRYNKTSLFQKMFTLFKEWRKRRFINEYDAFVVLTNEDAKCWKNIKNLHVIPNAISFIPENSSTCLNKQVISVGRLNVQKGYDMLLQAWSIVAGKYPDWRLVIYGQGEEHAKLQAMMQQYAIEGSVCIFPPTRDIVDKYVESSIYVMSSRYEGFPMVLPEAMACGLPCVSFMAPCGPSEIITQGEDGFLVPIDDIHELSEKLSILIADAHLRVKMGERARQNIMRYSVVQVMKQWERLFDLLLKK